MHIYHRHRSFFIIQNRYFFLRRNAMILNVRLLLDLQTDELKWGS